MAKNRKLIRSRVAGIGPDRPSRNGNGSNGRIEHMTVEYLRRLRGDPAKGIAPDLDEQGRFFISHKRLVIAIANRFNAETSVARLPGGKRPGEYVRVITLEDLIQAGMMGQMEALERFAESRCGEIKWGTYATWRIRRAMQTALREFREGIARIPESARDRAKKGDAEMAKTVRRMTYPLRLDHEAGQDDKPLRDIIPGKPTGSERSRESVEARRKIRTAVEDLAGIVPFHRPPRTIHDRVADVIWTSSRSMTVPQIKDAMIRAGWNTGRRKDAILRVRDAIRVALKLGWILARNGNSRGPRYDPEGPPRPPEIDGRNADIILRRLGLRGRTMTLQALGKRHGLSRERIRQIEEDWKERLRRDGKLKEVLI